MKSTIFWDITPCSPLTVNRRFGGTCRLDLHDRRISLPRNQRESRWQRSEYKGGMFLRNVGWLSTGYTASHSIITDFKTLHHSIGGPRLENKKFCNTQCSKADTHGPSKCLRCFYRLSRHVSRSCLYVFVGRCAVSAA
jgi:hypothetical protein